MVLMSVKHQTYRQSTTTTKKKDRTRTFLVGSQNIVHRIKKRVYYFGVVLCGYQGIEFLTKSRLNMQQVDETETA